VAAAVLALPVAARAETPCPNEQLRVETHSTSLPDCRAYELVTPPNKNGQQVLKPRVAPDGSRVAFSSLGAFNEAPANDTEAGATFIASRTSAGWLTSEITPSAQEFHNGFALASGNPSENGNTADFAEDLSASLFVQAPLTSKTVDARFYRQQLGGLATEIGPLSPPGRIAAFTQATAEARRVPAPVYAGATATLSHVLYAQTRELSTIEAWDWPGDSSAKGSAPSLYEYSGINQSEPEIVGVAPGAGEAKKRPIEAPALVSECGTILGGGAATPEDAMNAISRLPSSEEGSHIVFTASALNEDCRLEGGSGPPVNEVFTRIGGVRTVAVSEPTVADCATCDESHPATAVFQGASADGNKIFFISEQRYFDGTEGEVEGTPNLYEFDLAANDRSDKLTRVGTELVPTEDRPLSGVVRVTNDGSRVYFVSKDTELAANVDAKGRTAKEEDETAGVADNLYVADTETGVTSFVGTLVPADEGLWKQFDARPAEVAGGGRYLIFTSSADLTPDAAGSGQQVYRYDADTGELLRISVGDQGFNDDGNLGVSSYIVAPSYAGTDAGGPQPSSTSADGEQIFFQSPGALTPRALNEVCVYEEEGVCEELAENVYEWEAGRVYLISDGQDSGSTFRSSATSLVGTSESGDDVFFTSASRLVSEDTDTQQDVYDARVDGGVAPARSTSGCQGEGCQGSPAAPPVFVAPSSATFAGVGNLIPPASPSKPKAKVKTAAQVREQRLARALKACEKRAGKRRASCERQAKRRNRRSK
jgi:hypothetical protein